MSIFPWRIPYGRWLALSLTFCILLSTPWAAFAHATGEDYVFANFNESNIEGEFQVNYQDLEEKLGLQVPEDKTEALEFLRRTQNQVIAYFNQGFSMGPAGEEPYNFIFQPAEIFKNDTPFARYPFVINEVDLPDQLEITHNLFYEDDKTHRGLFLVQYNVKTDKNYGAEHTALVFNPKNSTQSLDLIAIPGLIGNTEMIFQGAYHIWIGIDHILFLLALLLPTVLVREQGAWKPVPRAWPALKSVLQIVTVFTIAHSITLLLAALDFVQVNSRLVESVIALSIVMVALNNIFQWVTRGSLATIMVLGLFHGLGFASVMGNLPFRMVDLVGMVVRFNVGVELGQLVIVAAIFPVLYFLRNNQNYIPVILKGISWLLFAIAAFWFFQRALGFG